ncbi:EscU/YscU/HrcU family type III secretion system export apparatus switch protein [Salipaludibacillus aurantiacus]|uniref:Flagellar biosynthesis protein n=1 Tax=Salipaludibacillus aurantiacus TaxID=1601833 RepID=A0A1H9QP32_9BACI|nr:EscU/YscU/HrcU family type III secretion system export apparatus switch protein [Salipaludibacillus aurantiacus]SER61599.1 flagellar biosynthesis protein [Salipaludibacillus aurantiacus]
MTDDFYKTGHTRLKQKRAVAMGYDEKKDSAPQIKAKGKGYTAEENGIPVQEDPSLVALLSQLEINERIPESLYEVVAEVFAFIYYVDREKTDK